MYQPHDLAIYIHWPFCKSKCPYCDFFKYVRKDVNQEDIVNKYITSLHQYHNLLPECKIKSIFFGGGTPSLLKAENVAKIIDAITGLWQINENCEITLEANPNIRYQTIFADLYNAGINRLSLGVQALNEEDLRFLGRTHNLEQARLCITEVVKTFKNHSVDLIYARPQQKIADWETELAEITSYGLTHISLYQLTIEPKTIFAEKGIKSLDEDDAVAMYNFTRDFLQNKNYKHYEVSNFALDGYQSVHNLTYWRGGDYIGIGESAHGRFCLQGEHIAAEYPFKHESLTADQRAEELIIMGLRLTDGIKKSTFKKICGIDFNEFVNNDNLRNLQEMKLIYEDKEKVAVTYKGISVLDEIIRLLCA